MQVYAWLNYLVGGGILASLLAIAQQTRWRLSTRTLVGLIPVTLSLMWIYIAIGPSTLG